MTTPEQVQRSKSELPIVVPYRRERCPKCGSIDIFTTRTMKKTEERIERNKRCRICDCRYTAVFD